MVDCIVNHLTMLCTRFNRLRTRLRSALGHPIGATGSILVGTVLDELERRDLNTGLVTLCVGAGMGTATIIERV